MHDISLILVNHNYSQHLEKCISSIACQTFLNFNVVVVDDGSDDNSVEIINSSEHLKNAKIIVNSEPVGLVESMRLAISASHCKYFVRVDADDWVESNFLQVLFDKAEKEGADLVFPNYYTVDTIGNLISKFSRHDFSEDINLYDSPSHGACTLVRRESYLSVGGYSNGLNRQDGVDLWLKFITNNLMVSNVPEHLFYYRQHTRSLSNNKSELYMVRSKIYSDHVLKNKLDTSTAVLVFMKADEINLNIDFKPFLNNVNLLEHFVSKVNDSRLTQKFFLVSSKIPESEEQVFCFLKRPIEYEFQGVSLVENLKYLIKSYKELSEFDNLVILTCDYPLLESHYIDQLIALMMVHRVDEIHSVLPTNSVVYKHNGRSLFPVNSQFSKHERDNIYLRKGGLSIYNVKKLASDNRVMSYLEVDTVSSIAYRDILLK